LFTNFAHVETSFFGAVVKCGCADVATGKLRMKFAEEICGCNW